jgi:hypothetical protein
MTDLRPIKQELAQLSDSEWLELKRAEDRRRADQHIIRDLAREHRDRKIAPEPPR